MHPEIKKGTLKSIIRQSGLSLQEFLKILKQESFNQFTGKLMFKSHPRINNDVKA
jgi:hypothetical protein